MLFSRSPPPSQTGPTLSLPCLIAATPFPTHLTSRSFSSPRRPNPLRHIDVLSQCVWYTECRGGPRPELDSSSWRHDPMTILIIIFPRLERISENSTNLTPKCSPRDPCESNTVKRAHAKSTLLLFETLRLAIQRSQYYVSEQRSPSSFLASQSTAANYQHIWKNLLRELCRNLPKYAEYILFCRNLTQVAYLRLFLRTIANFIRIRHLMQSLARDTKRRLCLRPDTIWNSQ